MMRRKLTIGLVLTLICTVIVGVVMQTNVSAYLNPQDITKATTQCYALQYEKHLNGQYTAGVGYVYSTKKICAKVDKEGKITSGKVSLKTRPKNTQSMKIKLTVSKNKKTVALYQCKNGKATCLKVQKAATFKVTKGMKLSDLATQINNAAQDSYDGGEKLAVSSNRNTNDAMKGEDKEKNGEDAGNSGSIQQTCDSMGGAESLGWIVCSLMTWLGETADNVYEEYVEPSLQVSPKLFTGGGEGNSVQDAWSTFQNIANIIFVILLLIVIFSQLTGVGIDNYGIKKILPKLIIAAVLINVSYLLCMVAVDLSNIVGNGAQALFNGMSEQLEIQDIQVDYDGAATTIATSTSTVGKIASVGVIAAAVTAVGTMWANPAIVLSLLVSALGVCISIFFLFILLAAREAAIIVLTVISPVAVVCYMLPNTKKLFDKWLKAFEGLLLVYPICGLLVGGGDYVAKLLLTAGFSGAGFVSAFTAMIAGIVPVFFIPSVLRSSFNALGGLGAKISGFGQRVSGGVTRGARNSQAYRNAQEMGLNRRTRLRAGMDRNGNLTTLGRARAKLAGTAPGRFIGADTRLARYGEQTKKNIGEQEAAGAILSGALAQRDIGSAEAISGLGSGFAAGTEGAYYGKRFLDAAARGDITRMNSAIQAMRESNMKPKDIAKLVRHAEANDMVKGDANAVADWRGKLASQYGNDFLATDAELGHYMKTRGANDIDMNYGSYAGSNMGIDDIKPQDIPNLSGDSLAGMAASGLLTEGMAKRVLASNPNVSEDKKIMLSALANGTKVTNAAQFKADAETLMKNHGAAVSFRDANGNSINVNKDMVDAWVANNPQEVNVVQNFNAGGGQVGPVDVK